jgi:hypothetical protein
MLQLIIKGREEWDEGKQEFVYTQGKTLQLEHSLVSLSKWEAKWQKAFLSAEEKTREETVDYIRCMTITQNVDPKIYTMLSKENLDAVNKYIECPMSATIVRETPGPRSHETVTSELIYYWMISYQIPFECQKWHLNRLLTLIRVCGIKNQPPKKQSKKDIMSRNSALNAARRKQLNTKG